MYFRNLLVSGLAGVASAQTSSTACPKKGVHVVAGPGSGGGPNDYGYLGSLVLSIEKSIPGSNNFCIGGYQGDNGLEQTESAEKQFREHLKAFTPACPHVPVVIVGYSAGAIGAMNTLCGASPAPPWAPSKPDWQHHNIIAAIVYGDETRQAGQPYDRGTCHNNAPTYPRTSSKGCQGFRHRIRSFCDAEDGDCCAGGNETIPVHFQYPKYDHRATKFVHALWRKHHEHHHGGKGHHDKKHHDKKHHDKKHHDKKHHDKKHHDKKHHDKKHHH